MVSCRLEGYAMLTFSAEVMGIPTPQQNTSASQSEENIYNVVFSSRAVQLLAIFAWVYVGTEVTVGGEQATLFQQSIFSCHLWPGWIVTVRGPKYATHVSMLV